MRYLRSRANSLDLQQQVAFKLPRDARWRQKQSINDRRRELGTVYQLATDILRELTELEATNGKPDMGSILADLAKEGSKVALEALQVIKEHGGHLDNVWLRATTMQNVPSILIIALIVGQLCARKIRGWVK